MVVADPLPANGTPPVGSLGLVKVPSINTNTVEQSSAEFYLSIHSSLQSQNLYILFVLNKIYQDYEATQKALPQPNGALSEMDSQQAISSPDLLGDLLGPLAIEGPPGDAALSEPGSALGAEATSNVVDALALAPVEEQPNSVQVKTSALMPKRLKL